MNRFPPPADKLVNRNNRNNKLNIYFNIITKIRIAAREANEIRKCIELKGLKVKASKTIKGYKTDVKLVIIVLIIIWFGDTVTVLHLTKRNKKTKVQAMSKPFQQGISTRHGFIGFICTLDDGQVGTLDDGQVENSEKYPSNVSRQEV